MKLLQLNAWTIRLETPITKMITQEMPDVIAFQEVIEADNSLGFFTRLTKFAKRLGYYHQYFSPVYGMRFMEQTAEFGNAIVSNFALKDEQTVFTNLEYKEKMSFEEDDYNVRNFQHVVIEDQNGKNIHIINHHGYHVSEHKRGNDFTLQACQQIVNYVTKLEGSIIITGDFNLEPSSESIAVLDKHFRNLTTEFNLKTTRTNLTEKTEVCDYIFVSSDVRVKSFYASDIVASDHQGLVLDFEV